MELVYINSLSTCGSLIWNYCNGIKTNLFKNKTVLEGTPLNKCIQYGKYNIKKISRKLYNTDSLIEILSPYGFMSQKLRKLNGIDEYVLVRPMTMVISE